MEYLYLTILIVFKMSEVFTISLPFSNTESSIWHERYGWIWPENVNNGNHTRKNVKVESAEIPSKYDPCTKYNPPRPDFESGYRISEAKCLKYIWNVKVQGIIQDRQEECDSKKQFLNEVNAVGVIGGRDTHIGEFPHMGALGWRTTKGTWNFLCGSTLISPKFTLTAAHCAQHSSRTQTGETRVASIFPEILDSDSQPVDVPLLKLTKHPSYRPPKQYYDIAIIELANAVTFTETIQPACLWTNHDTSNLGNKATLTGWGVYELDHKRTSPKLQAADVDIINTNLCNELLSSWCNRLWCGVQDQICAGKLEGGVDSCQGDSGGPLQIEIPLPFSSKTKLHFLIGVTSFGIGCARPNLPGVYIRVSSFVDWIESIVWR